MRIREILINNKSKYKMNKFFERLNLYDILAMLLPGGVLLLCILSSGSMYATIKHLPWMQHILSQTIFSKALCLGLLVFLFSYLLGVINHTLFTMWRALLEDRKWSFWKQTMRWCYKNEIGEGKYNTEICNLLENKTIKCDAKQLQRAYAKAHSVAMKTGPADTISTIEKQVAMLRDSIVPCGWLLIASLCKCSLSWKWDMLIVFGLIVFLTVIIWTREYKIFAIVLSCNMNEEPQLKGADSKNKKK